MEKLTQYFIHLIHFYIILLTIGDVVVMCTGLKRGLFMECQKKLKAIASSVILVSSLLVAGNVQATVLMPFAVQGLLGLFALAGIASDGFKSDPGYQIRDQSKFTTDTLYHVALWPEILKNPEWAEIALVLNQYKSELMSQTGDQTLNEMFGNVLTARLNTPRGKWFNSPYHQERGIDLSQRVNDFLRSDLSHAAILMARTIEYCNSTQGKCKFETSVEK